MDILNYKCVKVDFSDYAKEIGMFRRRIWEEEEELFDKDAFPKEIWLDEYEDTAIHWIVFDDKKIIASARLGIYKSFDETPYMHKMEQYKSLLNLPIASLNRLVVHKEYRNKGIGEMLDFVRIEEAKASDAKTIVGQAVSYRIKALQKFGFDYIADIGKIKEFPKIELSLMIKQL